MANQGNSHRTKIEDLLPHVKETALCCKNKDHIIASVLWQNASIKPIFMLPPPAQGGHLDHHPPNMPNPPRMYGKSQQYNRLNQDELYNEIYKRITGIKEIKNQVPHRGLPDSLRTQDVLDHFGVLSQLTRVKAKDPLVAACVWLDIHHIPSSEMVAGCLRNPLNDDNNDLWKDAHLQRCIERLPLAQVNRDKDGYKLYILHSLKKLFQTCETTSDPAFIKLFHSAPVRQTLTTAPKGTLQHFGGSPCTSEGSGWFNKLPPELRKTIWELVLEDVGPRTIQPYNIRGVIKVNCHLPALFHINHESRQIITSLLAGYQCFRPTENFPKDLIVEIDGDDEGYDQDDKDGEEEEEAERVNDVDDEDTNADFVRDVKDKANIPNVPNREFPPGNKAAGGIWFHPDKDTLYLGRRTFALAGECLTTGALRAQMPELLGAVKHLGLYLMSRSLWRVTDQTQFMEDLVHFSAVESLTGVVWDEYLSFEPFTSVLETQLTMTVDYNQIDTEADPNRKGVVLGFAPSPGYDGQNRDKYESYLTNIRDSWDRAEDIRVSTWNDNHPGAPNITTRSGIMKFVIAAATAHRPRNTKKTDDQELANAAGNLALKDEDDDGMEGVEPFTDDHSVSGSASRGATIEPTPAPRYPESVLQSKISELEAKLRLEREEKEKFKNALEAEKKRREAETAEQRQADWVTIMANYLERQAERQEKN